MFSLSHIHPMLVHFPIALVAVGFLADLISLFFKKEACLTKVGLFLLVVGTLSAMAALLSGLLFTTDLEGTAGEVMENHELFAWITVSILVVTSVLRIFILRTNRESTNLKWVAFALYALAAVSVSVTGFLGGSLVYNYMMPL